MKDEWVWRNQGRRIKEHRNREWVVIIPMGFNTSCAPEKGREIILHPRVFWSSPDLLLCYF